MDITCFKRQSDTHYNRLCPVPRRIIVKPKRSNGGKVVKSMWNLKGPRPLCPRSYQPNKQKSLSGPPENYPHQLHDRWLKYF